MSAAPPERPRPPTLGERRVRLGHNPSGAAGVTAVKAATAALIDILAEHAGAERRYQALAMTAAEEAGMWGVKAATHADSRESGPASPSEQGAAHAGRGDDPEPGSETGSGDPDPVPDRTAELERQVAELDRQLATARTDRDAFAGQATAQQAAAERLDEALEHTKRECAEWQSRALAAESWDEGA